jgi:hypothetical protein
MTIDQQFLVPAFAVFHYGRGGGGGVRGRFVTGLLFVLVLVDQTSEHCSVHTVLFGKEKKVQQEKKNSREFE